MIQGQESPSRRHSRSTPWCPWPSMFGYATDLRSSHPGPRPVHHGAPASYVEIPKSIAEKIIAERGRKDD